MGEFGNHSPSWATLEEYLASGYRGELGKIHIRNRVPNGPTFYNVRWHNVKTTAEGLWKKDILSPATTYFSCMAPHEYNLIQGEVYRGEWNDNPLNVYLKYSTEVGINMREALARGMTTCSGIIALLRLKFYLDANSWEWLQYLFDAYPGHVIEFSTFSVEWGTLAHHNTVVWEVRNY